MTESTLATKPLPYKPMRIRPKKWTRAEYDKAVNLGLFGEDDRIELIEGEIVQKMSHNPPHSRSIKNAMRALLPLTNDTLELSVQLPIALSDTSEPEPDLALVARTVNQLAHPETAYLIIEVANTSLRYDRGKKAAMYAKAGIADYWIININERVVEVYRDPIKVNGRGRYQTVLTFGEGETVAPLAFPDKTISVSELLP